jgi:hypothetical protein
MEAHGGFDPQVPLSVPLLDTVSVDPADGAAKLSSAPAASTIR